MKEKIILVNTPQGQFEVLLMAVALNRAEYYASERGFEAGSHEWQEAIDYVMEDDYNGIDWMLNNTNWSDWERSAVKVTDKVKVTDENFFTSSTDFQILERTAD